MTAAAPTPEAIHQDAALIDRLGGATKVAELLGLKRNGPQRVHNWKSRGIPAAVKVLYPELLMPGAKGAAIKLPPTLRELAAWCPLNPSIYISGPMTGLPGLNFDAFFAAEARLAVRGFRVVNPARLNPDPGKSWEQCMRTDIRALCDCHGVATLPGWEKSRGATLEVHVAEQLGLWVQPLDDFITVAAGWAGYIDDLVKKAA